MNQRFISIIVFCLFQLYYAQRQSKAEIYNRLSSSDNLIELLSHLTNSTDSVSEFTDSIKNKVSLRFSHVSGYYTDYFKLFIANPESPDDTIYYTLDGSIPTTSSLIYDDGIIVENRTDEPNTISNIPTTLHLKDYENYYKWRPPSGKVHKAMVLRAVSIRNNVASSKMQTHTFFVDTDIYSKYTFPVISLVTDPANFFSLHSGIYVSGYDESISFDYIKSHREEIMSQVNYLGKGKKWERPVHITYFDKNGKVAFVQDAGVRLQGATTKSYPQKSLRLYARNKYGNKYFNYPLFPHREDSVYKRFVLKHFGNCSDAFTQSIVRDLNIDMLDFIPVIVYINGEYWGVHIMRESPGKHYVSRRYNVHKDSVDILKENSFAQDGDNKNYVDLIKYLKKCDVQNQDTYAYIKTRIDISSFIDYQIANIYLNHYDWPGNNVNYWRLQVHQGKWRWIMFDMDSSWGLRKQYDYNSLEHATNTADDGKSMPNNPWSTFLLRTLLKNEEFQTEFVERFEFLMKTTFHKDTLIRKINEFRMLYQPEIYNHTLRWHTDEWLIPLLNLAEGEKSELLWWDDLLDKYYIDFAIKRPCYMKKYIMEKFELKSFKVKCKLDRR